MCLAAERVVSCSSRDLGRQAGNIRLNGEEEVLTIKNNKKNKEKGSCCYSAENLPLPLLLLPDPLPAGNFCWFIVPILGVVSGSVIDSFTKKQLTFTTRIRTHTPMTNIIRCDEVTNVSE
jgi:hypothetical protein